MNGTIDLHIHSCYSDDGEFTPSKIVEMCAAQGIKFMAIADHNCVKGVDEAIQRANQLHIHCYPAAEIDCTYKGINFHVLSYDMDYTSSDFEDIEQNIRRQCIRTSKERLDLINRLGFSLTENELREITKGSYWSEQWTPEVFAEALLNNETYQSREILLPYREGGPRSDNPYVNFYWDYCSQGKPCYVPIQFPEMKDIIDIIHKNRGRAVLAHPGVNLLGKFELIDELIPLGLDGLEVYSSYHNRSTANWFLIKTIQYNLDETRGSDFHGKTKPGVKLGQCEKRGYDSIF